MTFEYESKQFFDARERAFRTMHIVRIVLGDRIVSSFSCDESDLAEMQRNPLIQFKER